MPRVSPTLEGFRATWREPSLTFAEITWRWTVGATASTVFVFGFVEYLNTLPVSNGDLLFLRTRHPVLVGRAIAHILRGSLSRAAMAALLGTVALAALWIIAASIGRSATLQALLEYFAIRRDVASNVSADSATNAAPRDAADTVSPATATNAASPEAVSSVPPDPAAASTDASSRNVSTTPPRPRPNSLLGLNFLRAALTLAAILGLQGAAILTSFASTRDNPHPGLAFFLFLPIAALVCIVWCALNWLLSLATLFAVRDGEDTLGAVSSAVAFSRERAGAVSAVSTWSALAHLTAFMTATTVVAMPLSLLHIAPARLVIAGVLLVTLAYFAVADWLYMARLAGYVCIAEMPEELLAPPLPQPPVPPYLPPITPETTIDRNEPILSDVPNLVVET
jgi:hypothetical protein